MGSPKGFLAILMRTRDLSFGLDSKVDPPTLSSRSEVNAKVHG